MPIRRILAKGGAAALLVAATALAATAQDSTLGPFPEGHVPASARKLSPDTAERQKYAIVIGNQAYAHAPQLPNAWNDALDVADLLAGQGYDVTLLKDASKRDFEGLMQRVLFDVDRETEVLRLVAKGLSYKQIAERLVLSHRTVQNHVQNTLRKLQLHNRVQLVRYAIEQGLDDEPLG